MLSFVKTNDTRLSVNVLNVRRQCRYIKGTSVLIQSVIRLIAMASYTPLIVPVKMKQVASNKFSLLRKIILENTQTLQPFTKIIKTESVHKTQDAKLKCFVVERPSGLIKRVGKRKRF
jgi:hypothetical protein